MTLAEAIAASSAFNADQKRDANDARYESEATEAQAIYVARNAASDLLKVPGVEERWVLTEIVNWAYDACPAGECRSFIAGLLTSLEALCPSELEAESAGLI